MKYRTRDVELAKENLQALLLKLSRALAVCHEGRDDGETLPSILMEANLEAWRMHWQLVPCGVPEADAQAESETAE